MGKTIYANWMMPCTTLKTLQLIMCKNLEHLPSLGQLPFLEVLSISLFNLNRVGDEFLGIEDSKNKDHDIVFPNLKSLQFVYLRNWEEWIGMGGIGEEEEENDNGIVTIPIIIKIMPRLQSLKIFYCYNLKLLPDYLCTAPLLKELEIFGSLLLEESYKTGTGENWPRISHIPNIILGWVYVQIDGEPQN
uniref:R13L1/DRL21-like LRR repeat region domain-containing protein n=1 Tax=Quercus lobata TaxID=97700 RepID=A0A7N2LL66_QUELO